MFPQRSFALEQGIASGAQRPRNDRPGAERSCVLLPQCLDRYPAAPPLPSSGGSGGRGVRANAKTQ